MHLLCLELQSSESRFKLFNWIVTNVFKIFNFLLIYLRIFPALFLETLPSQSASNHSTRSDTKNYTGSNNSIPVIEKKSATPNSEGDVPLYSNIDYHPYAQNRADILALQHYVVEQAKSLGKGGTFTYSRVHFAAPSSTIAQKLDISTWKVFVCFFTKL